jgi:serine/threonine-protein kinase
MRGVAAAHAQGVIHRDLKPHNIFLCLDDRQAIRACKVLDFGVSKLTVADAFTLGDITLNGNLVGTPEYMAPEQIRAGRRIDHRIDVYSLGVVLYEALAGRPPFVNRHFSGLMLEIMQNDPPALSTFRADVPPRLAAVIHRALAKDLGWRFPDVPSFIKELESVAREDLKMSLEARTMDPSPGASPPASSVAPSASPPLEPTRYLYFVVAAVVLVLGIATFVVAWVWGR